MLKLKSDTIAEAIPEVTPRFTHRVYGRMKGESRFRPLNLKDCRFVVNLIYATMLTESESKLAIDDLKQNNPTMEFEARKMSEMF